MVHDDSSITCMTLELDNNFPTLVTKTKKNELRNYDSLRQSIKNNLKKIVLFQCLPQRALAIDEVYKFK